MRNRARILASLETVFRRALEEARESHDAETDRSEGGGREGAGAHDGAAAIEARLDLEYQLEQLRLEVLLDIRDLLSEGGGGAAGGERGGSGGEDGPSLLDRAEQFRRITRRK